MYFLIEDWSDKFPGTETTSVESVPADERAALQELEEHERVVKILKLIPSANDPEKGTYQDVTRHFAELLLESLIDAELPEKFGSYRISQALPEAEDILAEAEQEAREELDAERQINADYRASRGVA